MSKDSSAKYKNENYKRSLVKNIKVFPKKKMVTNDIKISQKTKN